MNTARLRYGLCARRSPEEPGSSARTSSTPSSRAATRCSSIDDLSFGKREYVNAAATLVERDIRDGIDLGGVDVVFHLAAQTDVQTSVSEPARDAEVNVVGTVRVLEAALEAGAQVVFTSTGGAIYGECAASRHRVDAAASRARRTGSRSSAPRSTSAASTASTATTNVVARLGNVFGPRQSPSLEGGVVSIFLDRMARGEKTVIFGDGLQVRDFIYVGDVVDALLAAAGHRGRRLQRRDAGSRRPCSSCTGPAREVAGVPSEPRFEPARLGDLRRSALDVSRAASELGFRARTSLADGHRPHLGLDDRLLAKDSTRDRRKSAPWTPRFSRRTT